MTLTIFKSTVVCARKPHKIVLTVSFLELHLYVVSLLPFIFMHFECLIISLHIEPELR